MAASGCLCSKSAPSTRRSSVSNVVGAGQWPDDSLCEFKTDAQGSIFVQLNAKQDPPKGVKAKGVFVDNRSANAPLQPTGTR